MIKLIDVPEMGHYVLTSGVGEICIKGSNVFKGYVKPERNEGVLDDEGWLKTGDIGCWSSKGALKILVRKQNMFRLNSGVIISPERIEGIYNQSAFVSQCFVDGDNTRVSIVTINHVK